MSEQCLNEMASVDSEVLNERLFMREIHWCILMRNVNERTFYVLQHSPKCTIQYCSVKVQIRDYSTLNAFEKSDSLLPATHSKNS